jgi:hypothetical protein
MNEKAWGGLGQGIAGSLAAGAAQCKPVERITVPMLIDSIRERALSLRASTEIAADNLSGGIPQPELKEPNSCGGILGQLQEIIRVLEQANQNQQRALNALAL